MKSKSALLIVFILVCCWGCHKKTVARNPAPLPSDFSFARNDSLLPAEKIDTSLLETEYTQAGYPDDLQHSACKLLLNKDGSCSCSIGGWIHQYFSGNWIIKNDTLNFQIQEYNGEFPPQKPDAYLWKFVLVNKNFYAVIENKRIDNPYLCKKLYDQYRWMRSTNW